MNIKIFLKELTLKDISNKYIDWLNDYDVTKYTAQVNIKNNKTTIKKYINEILNSKNNYLYGIYIKEKSQINHIGNIKLGPIDYINKSSYISYFIGEKNYWGKNIATCAIKKIIKISKKMKLKKLLAGTHELNKPSQKVLKKNNFKLEGIFKSQLILKKKDTLI